MHKRKQPKEKVSDAGLLKWSIYNIHISNGPSQYVHVMAPFVDPNGPHVSPFWMWDSPNQLVELTVDHQLQKTISLHIARTLLGNTGFMIVPTTSMSCMTKRWIPPVSLQPTTKRLWSFVMNSDMLLITKDWKGECVKSTKWRSRNWRFYGYKLKRIEKETV